MARLYIDGGIEICTRHPTVIPAPLGQHPLLARTVIQPDADIVTYVSEKLVDTPEYWRMHLDNVRNEINSIRRLRLILKWSGPASLPPLLLGIYNVAAAHANLWERPALIAWGFSVGIALLCLKTSFLAVRLILHRAFIR